MRPTLGAHGTRGHRAFIPTPRVMARRRQSTRSACLHTAMTTTPQPGIFAVGSRSHHHLQLDVDPGADRDALFAALRDIREHATTVAGVNLVIGFGSALCRRLAPHWLPDGVEPFETLTGAG